MLIIEYKGNNNIWLTSNIVKGTRWLRLRKESKQLDKIDDELKERSKRKGTREGSLGIIGGRKIKEGIKSCGAIGSFTKERRDGW